ncbi:MAG: class I SAM-dependent methyltransferase [Promethearchaeota archaeon]
MRADLPEGLRESGAIEVRERFGVISGGDILDVGTNDGDFIKVLMKVLKDYNTFTGIDISEDELDKAREQFIDDPVSVLMMNAESMTFPDNQFDTVCISYSIHHLENIDKVLAEMYRVLKPGGHFIIQEMYSDGEQTQAQQVDKLVHHLNVKVDSLLGVPHFETLTRQNLRTLVEKIGLRDVESFESTWSVKCLFCDAIHDCENPTRPNHIESILRQIDDTLSRVCELPLYDELREEAESLKKRVKTHGSSAASVMYLIAKK